MVDRISSQHGITAAELRENELHPTFPDGKPIGAWSIRARTLRTLVDGHNDAQDRLAALEAAVARIPFPLASS